MLQSNGSCERVGFCHQEKACYLEGNYVIQIASGSSNLSQDYSNKTLYTLYLNFNLKLRYTNGIVFCKIRIFRMVMRGFRDRDILLKINGNALERLGRTNNMEGKQRNDLNETFT